MEFERIRNPAASRYGFDAKLESSEMAVTPDLVNLVISKLRQAHEELNLPEPPAGYQWDVDVKTLYQPDGDSNVIRAVYKLKEIN